jgi:uncharacterized membrane protein
MRFISSMGYDKKAFSAAIVNMAVKGFLNIEESNKDNFILRKNKTAGTKLAIGEGAIASALFGDGETEISLKKVNHTKISKAIKAHKRSLKGDYEKNYFVTNKGYLTPGIILSIISLAVVVILLPDAGQVATAAFMSVWLTIWSIGVFVLILSVISAWKGESKGGAIFITLFSIPFIGGEIVGLLILITQVSVIYALTLLCAVAVNILFYQWLKSPTLAGRKLLDRIEGFKLYLSMAEKDELNFKHPPEQTPELFEKYLPYAIALGVEQQWGERFSKILNNTITDSKPYRPSWYHGKSWSSGNIGTFTSSIGSSMSSAISSSSTAPGSTSGSGGGGFSGGGGGGGGGGGW